MDALLQSRAEQLAGEFAGQATTVEELNELMRLMMKSGLERMLDTEMDVHLGRRPLSAGASSNSPPMPAGEKNYSPSRRSRKKIYDFPAEDWKHLRTTNPIESVIATVPLQPQAHQRKRLAHRLLGDGPPTDALRRQEMAAA